MTTRMDCVVLGATGAVGQRFVQLLADHPWFHVTGVTATPAKAGQPYHDAVDWCLEGSLPPAIADMSLMDLADLEALDPSTVVFSALPSDVARTIERRLADQGLMVFTNASPHRMDPDVPLLIPEVNAVHADRLPQEGGGIVANGNCSGIILTLALAPLHHAFGIASVDVTTMQARSGAGHPGRVVLDTAGNVLPLIPGEETKLQQEPQKMLNASFPVYATCTRVDVLDGHLETVHARLGRPVTEQEVRDAFASFQGDPDVRRLPSAPRRPIHLLDGDEGPQPKHHVNAEDGMAITVGRIRVDGSHVRFVVLGHNTVRGAAGQSVLNAEFLHVRGRLPMNRTPDAVATT